MSYSRKGRGQGVKRLSVKCPPCTPHSATATAAIDFSGIQTETLADLFQANFFRTRTIVQLPQYSMQKGLPSQQPLISTLKTRQHDVSHIVLFLFLFLAWISPLLIVWSFARNLVTVRLSTSWLCVPHTAELILTQAFSVKHFVRTNQEQPNNLTTL